MKKQKNTLFIFFAASICFLFNGCNPDGIFYEFKSFKNYDAATVYDAPVNSAAVKAIEKSEEASLSFFALGCAGTGNDGQKMAADFMAKTAEEQKPGFVLYLGDNFYGRGVSSISDPQWKAKFEDIYDSGKLAIPFYAVLGNHDYYKNPQAQIDYSATQTRWKMPAAYYSFEKVLSDGTTVQFFGLDTTAMVKGRTADQLKWLEENLRDSKADWKIVYGHHPLYSGARTYIKQMALMRQLLEPLFIKYKVNLYAAAHNHSIEVLKSVSGVNYVVSGGGSRPRNVYWIDQTKFAHADLGFVGFRIFKSSLAVYVISGRDGKLLFSDSIPKNTV